MTDEQFGAYLSERGKADEVIAALDQLGFTREFVVRNVLNSREELTVAQTAMLWQGMPNKHDRKRTHQLFAMLTEIGLLEADPNGEIWRSNAK